MLPFNMHLVELLQVPFMWWPSLNNIISGTIPCMDMWRSLQRRLKKCIFCGRPRGYCVASLDLKWTFTPFWGCPTIHAYHSSIKRCLMFIQCLFLVHGGIQSIPQPLHGHFLLGCFHCYMSLYIGGFPCKWTDKDGFLSVMSVVDPWVGSIIYW